MGRTSRLWLSGGVQLKADVTGRMTEHHLRSSLVGLLNALSGQSAESLVDLRLACMVWRRERCINLTIG